MFVRSFAISPFEHRGSLTSVSFTAPPSLATFIAIGIAIPVVLALLTGVLAPNRPTEAKSRPYESGVSEPFSSQTRWPVRFALVGMLFLIFDVEALFFYPWATILRELGWFGIVAVLSFFVVLSVGYVYARARGAFEWR